MAPSSNWQFPGKWGQTGGQPLEILQPLGWHEGEGESIRRVDLEMGGMEGTWLEAEI